MVFHRKVLVLSPYPEGLLPAIAATGDRAEGAEVIAGRPDWVVMFGHRHIIREPWLSALPGHLVNLHISYLPWGRGADPNLWAWVDGEPHGVTLHHVDAGLDTGDIIAQRRVTMDQGETLASSYQRLRKAAEVLFAEAWPDLRNGYAARTPQPKGQGSCHRLADREAVHLPQGWDTPTAYLARQSSRALRF
jgi:methionyl-tRNA formyltransferase